MCPPLNKPPKILDRTAAMKTSPDLFIMESLSFDDERHGRAEGGFLAHVLRHSNRRHKYFYFRTAIELRAIAEKFGRSNYRYLHLSCHADVEGISTTLDSLSYQELAEALRPYLRGKRVFFSACGAANQQSADALMTATGCLSVMGPSEDIRFDDSAIVWASFYHRIFRLPDNETEEHVVAMKRQQLIDTASRLAQFYHVPFRFFYRDNFGRVQSRVFSKRVL